MNVLKRTMLCMLVCMLLVTTMTGAIYRDEETGDFIVSGGLEYTEVENEDLYSIEIPESELEFEDQNESEAIEYLTELAKLERIEDIMVTLEDIEDDDIYYVNRMKRAHELAEMARAYGCAEDSPVIVKAQEVWAAANEEFCYDRDIIATVVYNEAGYGCSYRHMELVAAVVVNRRDHWAFPDTIYDVVVAPRQYSKAYVNPNSYYGKAARNADNWETCQSIAASALRYEVDIPYNVCYQAEFTQGQGTYEVCKTSYSTTYFCYTYE